jgi:hypothetical protein
LTGDVAPAAVKSTAEFGPDVDNLPRTFRWPLTTPWALARLASANSGNARIDILMFIAYPQLLSHPQHLTGSTHIRLLEQFKPYRNQKKYKWLPKHEINKCLRDGTARRKLRIVRNRHPCLSIACFARVLAFILALIETRAGYSETIECQRV